MNTKSLLRLAFILILFNLMLFGLQTACFSKALLYQDLSTRIRSQSPANNESYAGVVPLNVTLRFDIHEMYLHSASIPYQNISCVYSLDNNEWMNIPFERVSSSGEFSDPLTHGYIYQIGCTYNTHLQGLSAGEHFINVTVKPNGVLPNDYYSWYNDSAVYFVVKGSSVSVLSSPSLTQTSSPTLFPLLSTLGKPTPTPESVTVSSKIVFAVVLLAAVLAIISFVTIFMRKKRNKCSYRIMFRS
jgi:hypothetical protein